MSSHIPIELYDEIVGFIDHPRDLLKLALCCKVFHRLVIPHHIQYRHIRCPVDTPVLWQTLVALPLLALRVRRLELIPKSDTGALIPQVALRSGGGKESNTDDVYHDCTIAVSGMSKLIRLWIHDNAVEYEYFGHFFRSVKPRLVELQVEQALLNRTGALRDIVRPLFHLCLLSKLCLKLRCSETPETLLPITDEMRPLIDFVVNNVLLTDIHITIYNSFHSFAWPILKWGSWRCLRRLTLIRAGTEIGMVNGRDYDISSFLSHHPRLERLCLKVPDRIFFGTHSSTDTYNDYPHLRALRMATGHRPIRFIPRSISQSLESVYGDGLDPQDYYRMSSLRYLAGYCCTDLASLERLVDEHPYLERLHIAREYHGFGIRDYPYDTRIHILSQLGYLTHICGMFSLTGPALAILAKSIPTLRIVQIRVFDNPSVWIQIERDDDDSVVDFNEISSPEGGSDDEPWSDFFYGL
ncbi:hypothetical protein M422DRAFT_31509 [Sphaerobolus stellatus SS14]|uniref:F-box domain-containing protein n=1 Tax=Sphaerobolus stellatus (strain SS14) TaxID=990650 RepID=A0A0C9VV35_SPHS4|nr:hypothetical protein M422DRAFT_31509 [Sphaerobolus stellatus SS14]